MSAVESLSPVCVDVAREAPKTLNLPKPRSEASGVAKPPAPSAASVDTPTALRREERWAFSLIGVFAALLIAVALQPANTRPAAQRDDARYASMDGGASLLAGARVALARSVR